MACLDSVRSMRCDDDSAHCVIRSSSNAINTGSEKSSSASPSWLFSLSPHTYTLPFFSSAALELPAAKICCTSPMSRDTTRTKCVSQRLLVMPL